MAAPRNDAATPSRGFTLIELLVVVAIIAVLISILLPSLKGARDQAKQLLCNTNMRAMGEASAFYAAEHDDWISRHNDNFYHMHFAASLLINLKPDKRIQDWNGRILNLWNPSDERVFLEICAAVPQYQCPAHPVPQQPLDYVVSGFPWPYTVANARRDVSGGGAQGERYRPGRGGHMVNFFKLNGQRLTPQQPRSPYRVENSPVAFRLGELIFITEGHVALPRNELRYHDLFFTSHLPFAAWPRVGNDRRHPGGVNSLFFDGHAATMSHKKMDSGFGRSIGLRLHWFAPTVEELF